MTIRVVRLGAPRAKNEGLRLGTVRRPPRGVPKTEYAKRDFFDLWLPELAPSDELLAFATAEPWTARRWSAFEKRYVAEMKKPVAQRVLALVAALSAQAEISVGCYCEDETRCHRSILRKLLEKSGAKLA